MSRRENDAEALWTIRTLDARRDTASVTALYMACADYALLETGAPPATTAGADFLAETPPGHPPDRMLKLGVYDGAALVGVIDVARAFPDPDSWYLGLLMLAPGVRGAGLGSFVLAHLDRMARADDARRILLCVFDENPRALRFWQREGFVPVRELPPRAFGAKMHSRKELARPTGIEAPR